MIADNIWKGLAVVLVIAGIVFWFKTSNKKKDFKGTAREIAELVAYQDDSKPRSQKDADERFIKAVALLHEAKRKGTDREKLLAAVHEENGFRAESSHAKVINQRLEESLDTCRKFGILDDETIRDLEEGVKVKIAKGPYEGETITVTQHVPPSVAPDAEYFAGNLLIVPYSVAEASKDLVVTDKMREVAEKLRNAKVISEAEMEAISSALFDMREKAKKM